MDTISGLYLIRAPMCRGTGRCVPLAGLPAEVGNSIVHHGLFDTLVGKTLIGSNESRYGYGEVEHTTDSLQCREPACRRGGGEHITVAYRCERNQAEVK